MSAALEVRATRGFENDKATSARNDAESGGSSHGESERYRYAWDDQKQRSVPIAIEHPPPQPEVIETNRYVPYESDQHQRAYIWAAEQVARKFPSTIETLTTLDSLIQQQLNASK